MTNENFTAGVAAFRANAEARRQANKGRRGTHELPPSTPELRARADAARLAANARRREVAHALYQGRLGFIELRNMVRVEPAISHMRLKPVLEAMKWDKSTLTKWRLRDLTFSPGVKLGQLKARQWAVLVSAWPMPHIKRMERCLAQPDAGMRAERAARREPAWRRIYM